MWCTRSLAAFLSMFRRHITLETWVRRKDTSGTKAAPTWWREREIEERARKENLNKYLGEDKQRNEHRHIRSLASRPQNAIITGRCLCAALLCRWTQQQSVRFDSESFSFIRLLLTHTRARAHDPEICIRFLFLMYSNEVSCFYQRASFFSSVKSSPKKKRPARRWTKYTHTQSPALCLLHASFRLHFSFLLLVFALLFFTLSQHSFGVWTHCSHAALKTGKKREATNPSLWLR